MAYDFLTPALEDGIQMENVLPPIGNEAYRIRIPGLNPDLSLPVYEADRFSNQQDELEAENAELADELANEDASPRWDREPRVETNLVTGAARWVL
jgi:hypothetical protein